MVLIVLRVLSERIVVVFDILMDGQLGGLLY